MRTLEHIDNEYFRMDRARRTLVPQERLREPRNPKELAEWCAKVKVRIEENRNKRRQHMSLLPHYFLINEVDYVQFTKKRDERRNRLIRVHFWQMWMLLSNIVISFAGRDVGKALDVDTPIATPEGWRRMGDLRAGDDVFGPDGHPTKIVGVSPVMLGRDCYRVRFDDGAEIVADAEHLWLTFDKRARRALSDPRRRTPPAVRTTAEIFSSLRYGKRRPGREGHHSPIQEYNHAVLPTYPVQYDEVDLPIDPYVLGVWLGDGSAANGRVTLLDADVAIVDRIRSKGYEVDRRGYEGRCPCWNVRGLCRELRLCGLKGNKHIPSLYLRASVEQRLELLYGLMDTDGTVTLSNELCEFANTNRRVVEGALEILDSLGIKTTVRTKQTGHKPCYRVSFKPDRQVFTLPRKAARSPLKERVGWRFIVACEPTESVPVRCIRVARPDGLFLAGRRYVLTHNTASYKWCLEQRATNYPNGSCLITGHSDDRITTVWSQLIQTSMPKDRWGKHFLGDSEGSSRVRPPCHRFFTNGFRLFGRPANDSNATKAEGPHCHGLLIDEAQEYQQGAWEKLVPAINPYEYNIPYGSMAKIFGVNSQGRIDNVFYHLAFRDAFYKYYRCTFPSWYNPDYNREQHIKMLNSYDGSIHSSAFKQTVRGLTGERQRGLVDQTAYNICCLLGNQVPLSQRRLVRIDKSTWARHAGDIEGMMIIEGLEPYREDCDMLVLSMDYGGTAPSELGIWARLVNPGPCTDANRMIWALWTRIQIQGIIGHDQAAVVDWLFEFMGLDYAAIDSTASTDKIWDTLNDPRHQEYAGKGYEDKIFPAVSNRSIPIRYQEEEPNKALAPAGAVWKPYDVSVDEGWKYRLWALMQNANVLASQKVAAMIQSHQLALPGKDYELQNELMSIVEKNHDGKQPTYVGAGAYAGMHRFSMVRSLALFVHDRFTLKEIQSKILNEEDAVGMEEAGLATRLRMPEISRQGAYA